jgi:peroxiredoxin
MKRPFLFLFLAFTVMYSCSKTTQQEFTVKGNIHGMKAPYIYFRWQGLDSTHVDSAAIHDDKFSFRGKVANPEMAGMYIKDDSGHVTKQVRFYLENSDIQISGNADSLNNAKITGSQSQDEYETYKASVKDLGAREAKLYKKYRNAKKKKNDDLVSKVEDQIDSLDKQRKEKSKNFITSHPKSYISLFQLRMMAYSTPYKNLNKLFTGLDKKVQNSKAGKKMAKHLSKMKKTAVGQTAPGFTQDDVNGEPVSLSDFKGKYVLVDFWASWCGPCREENPNVVKAYKEYKDKGFAILGVSLDDSSSNWKKAIKEDHLNWTQVSDLKGWKNAVAQKYGVRAIPSNWLIDPKGKIVGHNLRGDGLEKKLAEIFNK